MVHLDRTDATPHISRGPTGAVDRSRVAANIIRGADGLAVLQPIVGSGAAGADGADGSNVLPTDVAIANAIGDSTSATFAALRMFDPRAYGAVGDGAADDTDPFQDAIDAAVTAQGTVWISEGDYLVAGNLTAAGPVSIRASREPNAAGARILFEDTGTLFETDYTTTWDDVTVISLDGTGGTAVVLNAHQLSAFRGCTFANLRNGISSVDSVAVTADNCTFSAIRDYGMHFEYDGGDAGDHTIVNNLFTASGAPGVSKSHVHCVSSAGLKIVGNKFLGCDRAIDVESTKAAMSVLVVSGNSIEYNAVESIRVCRMAGSPTGDMSMVSIVGNEIGTAAGGSAGDVGIRCEAGYGWTIVGNVFVGPNTAGSTAVVSTVLGAIITGNTFVQWDIGVDNVGSGAQIGTNNCDVLVNTPVVENLDVVSDVVRPAVDHHHRVRVTHAASDTAPLSVFEVEVGAFGVGVILEINLAANLYTVGEVHKRIVYAIDNTPALTSLSSHASGVAGLTFAAVVSSGKVYVQVTDTGGKAWLGYVTLRAHGSPCTVRRLIAA